MTLPIDIFPSVMRALDLISQGHTVSAACDLVPVSPATFNKYVRDTPELSDMFAEAEQRGYDRMADRLLTMDDGDPLSPYSQTDPKKMKILSDNIKWYLSRKRPQQYGERVVVETTITADRAIIDALERGRQRAIGTVVLEDVSYEVVRDMALLPAPSRKNAAQSLDLRGVPDDLLPFV